MNPPGLSILGLLAFVHGLPVSSLVSPSVVVVSPAGSDTEGDGTVSNPLQTVAACIKMVAASKIPGGQCRLR